MTRRSHLKWLVLLAGLVTVGVTGLSAASGSATIVCPQGIKPPSPYCVNVPPLAVTGNATRVRATSATLNGVAGPNVRNGDVTQYYFEYGATPLYGSQTPLGTIGRCPFGITPPSQYCSVPKKKRVSADIRQLAPCTTYHFQLVAQSPDGVTDGGDNTFTTRFAPPLTGVFAPGNVRSGDQFTVFYGLRYDTDSVTILIAAPFGGVIQSVNLGPQSAGRHFQTLTAPNRRGDYVLVVLARLSCGRQSIVQRLRVGGRGRFGF
jgi:hypothetical protein